MPRNGSGTFTLVSGNPVVTGTTIESNWANTTLSDIATTLTDSLSRSGQGGMTAALRIADGTQGAPGVGFANETGSGFYRAGTGEVWAVVQGSQTLNLDANGVYVPADKTTTVDGAFVFNEAGADKDARFEGDTDANLLFTDASTDRVGIGTNTPSTKLHVVGDVTVSGAVNATTLDLTNIEVTNIKAKDGTASMTLADSTGVATLSANPILDAGTANGVAYLNASKVLTSGSNITFDGSNIQRITASSAALQLFKDSTPTVAARFAINTDYANAAEMSVFNGTSWAHNFVIDSTGYAAWRLGGSERMRLDSSGNLGLGVTPSAWNANYKALQFPSGGIGAFTTASVAYAQNAFDSGVGAWKYMNNGAAGLYNQSGGSHAWFTAPSGTAGNTISFTQAMTLDASGNLGVNNTSPTEKFGANYKNLSVSGTVGATVSLEAGGQPRLLLTADGTASYISAYDDNPITFNISSGNFASSTGTERARITSGGLLLVGTSTAPLANTIQTVINGSNAGGIELVKNNNGGVAIVPSSGGGVEFVTFSGAIGSESYTERARITSGGDLLVGQSTTSTPGLSNTTNGSAFRSVGDGFFSASGTVAVYANRNTNDGAAISLRRGGTEVGTISVTASATAYNTSSDYRLKDNPQPLTNSGAFIDALQPKTWNWKVDGSRGVGFIAHEAQTVSPSSVVGEKDAVDEDGKPVMQAMEYGSAEFIANIIAELQSLRARVAALEAQP